jgi:hypothetical protein
MRLSDAGLLRRPSKRIYPNHKPPPWLTEDAAPRSLEPIVRQPHHAVHLHISDLYHRYFKAADKFRGSVIEPAS